MNKGMLGVVLLSGVLMVAGCATDAQTGALIGSGLGAAVGQAIGGDTESTLIGGAVGGGLGYAFGNERDKAQATREREAIRYEANTQVVSVRLSNGSTRPVRLRRVGDRWMGPKGEYYRSFPTEAQLREFYGF